MYSAHSWYSADTNSIETRGSSFGTTGKMANSRSEREPGERKEEGHTHTRVRPVRQVDTQTETEIKRE